MDFDLLNSLIGIVIGIRFRSNFSIGDNLGNIVDKILYSKNSFFNPKVFPKAITPIVDEKQLINEETGDSLKINTSNIILEINFGEHFNVEDLKSINERFNKEIINGVMKDFKITQIVRVGYVKKYIFEGESFAKLFLDRTIGSTISGINDINLRFSKKYPIEEAVIKKDVNDYHNAIFNIIKQADRDELYIAVDYQKYFDPFLESVTQLELLNFIDILERYNKVDYVNWLNLYYGTKNN